MPSRPRAALLPLVVLALAIALMIGVWWWTSSKPRHVALPALPPDDDLPLIPATVDSKLGATRPRDILVAGGDRLYLSRASEHSIVVVPKSGGAGVTLARIEGPVWGMAFEDGALWLTTSLAALPPAHQGAVMKLGLGGGAPVVVADGFTAPHAMATDGHWIFVVDVDPSTSGLLPESAIVRISARGEPRTVVARSRSEVADVGLDESNVYWADRLEGTILAAPKIGGEPRTLASGRELPGNVVVDGDALFWVEERSESLWTMSKGGGSPRQIAQDFAGFAVLATDAHSLWWANATAVDGSLHAMTMPRTGGEPSVAVTTTAASMIGAIASDGTRVYWERDGRVSPVVR